mgnify:CR=1 FL=1
MPDPPAVFRFGPFRLDVAERRLSRNEEVLPLRLKVFDTLRILVGEEVLDHSGLDYYEGSGA